MYKSLQESTDTEQVNKRFAQMIVEQFRTQASLKAVCQAVVDQTMSIYQEYCSQSSISPRRNNRNTLLIRNFNFQLPNGPTHRSPLLSRQNFSVKPSIAPNKPKTPPKDRNQNSSLTVLTESPLPAAQAENQLLCVPNDRSQVKENSHSPEGSVRSQNNATVRFNPIIQSLSHSSINDGSEFETFTNGSSDQASLFPNLIEEPKEVSPNHSGEHFLSTITSQFTQESNFPDSSSNTDSSSDLYPNNNRLLYDKNRKIEAYVDFTQYYENVEKARQNGTLHTSLTDL